MRPPLSNGLRLRAHPRINTLRNRLVVLITLITAAAIGSTVGAKGLGELPMDGLAPAVVNALRHYGLDVREIPAIPELIAKCSLR